MTGQRDGRLRVSTLDQSTIRQLDSVDLDSVCEDGTAGTDLSRTILGLRWGKIPR